MIAKLAKAVGVMGIADGRILGADAVLVLALLVLFLGWVILSENRTRHLAKLIRALRGPTRSRNGSRTQRPPTAQ
jgi:hypothetical protein